MMRSGAAALLAALALLAHAAAAAGFLEDAGLAVDAAAPALPLSPPVWPERFKSVMFQNRTNRLALVTLYYDWPRGANLNLIASQLGAAGTVWDLEWTNGTSFIFSRDAPVCKTLSFDVGLLTPDWLSGAKHLGRTVTDSFVTDVWTKADFINYYADASSGRPVRWTFLWSGAEFHTMTWEEGATLPKHLWQAPKWCFGNTSSESAAALDQPLASGEILRAPRAHEQARRAVLEHAAARQAQHEQALRAAAPLS